MQENIKHHSEAEQKRGSQTRPNQRDCIILKHFTFTFPEKQRQKSSEEKDVTTKRGRTGQATNNERRTDEHQLNERPVEAGRKRADSQRHTDSHDTRQQHPAHNSLQKHVRRGNEAGLYDHRDILNSDIIFIHFKHILPPLICQKLIYYSFNCIYTFKILKVHIKTIHIKSIYTLYSIRCL